MHDKNPDFTKRQLQVIRGTILGGSSIVKPKAGTNCYLSIRSKNKTWFEFKIAELENFSRQHSIHSDVTYRWQSTCYPIFNEFREEFYQENARNLKIDSLNVLTDVAMGIWVTDSAKLLKNSLILKTNIWGKDGTEVINEYFGLIGYNSKVILEKGLYRVQLDEESSEKVKKLVSPHLAIFWSRLHVTR